MFVLGFFKPKSASPPAAAQQHPLVREGFFPGRFEGRFEGRFDGRFDGRFEGRFGGWFEGGGKWGGGVIELVR